MDIVTHAMMGLVGASPAFQTHPIGAVAFVFGSVAPDLDAFSRVFGKNAFMRFHQTYSHSLPIILCTLNLIWAIAKLLGVDLSEILFGLGCGMFFHSLLDVSNTYGIKLFAPFSNKRYSLEWVFFIDLSVIAFTGGLLVWLVWILRVDPGSSSVFQIGTIFWVGVTIYWSLKSILKKRSMKVGDDSLLVPCAFFPWRFFGSRQVDQRHVELFLVNAITRKQSNTKVVEVDTSRFANLLETIPEFQTMQNLSPMFHLVNIAETGQGMVLTCNDLRTRNFNTTFGQIKIELSDETTIRKVQWRV